jgi:hypothetical protein
MIGVRGDGGSKPSARVHEYGTTVHRSIGHGRGWKAPSETTSSSSRGMGTKGRKTPPSYTAWNESLILSS